MAARGSSTARRLALLDVDGTLTDTVAIDLRCFLETLAGLFGFSARAEDYDWTAVGHATDPGLLRAAFRRFADRAPSPEEEAVFVRTFVTALESAAREKPMEFRAIGGARDLLEALWATGEWRYAVATGCYAESARLKLDLAGLQLAGEPVATASDAVSRDEIFGLALRRAMDGADPTRAVLVGDGTWDAATARFLNLPFVGVARGERVAELEQLGAVAVVPDFHDASRVLQVLCRATDWTE